jgi:jasmonate O-methyltransferase
LREIIEAEGSFSIHKAVVHEPAISVERKLHRKMRGLRAVVDPIIVQHFGASAELLEEFRRVTEQIIKMSPQDEYPSKPRAFQSIRFAGLLWLKVLFADLL